MAKRKVNFKVTDGMKPRKLDTPGKPFGLRVPFAVSLPEGGTRALSVGVSCDLPVLVVDSAGATLFAPNKDLVVNLSSAHGYLNFGEGEVVAKAYVIDNTDMEVA